MTAWFLKLHRWLALLFALPLALVIGTGLILSFEPSLVVANSKPGNLSVQKIETILARHDPAGKARGITYRSYDGSLTVGGGRGAAGISVDAATGAARSGGSTMATLFGTSRSLHEHLLFSGSGLTIASTIALLVIAVIGVLMGWPRFANSVSGWHKGTAWVALPLLILSPLTGLAMAFGITFAGPPQAAAAPVTLVEAVRTLGKSHDLSGLIWLRERRGQMLARIVENGEYRLYAIDSAGVRPLQRNWPRLLHEGNWMGHASAAVNVVTSAAMIVLLVTGFWIWARKQLRRRRNIALRTATSSVARAPG